MYDTQSFNRYSYVRNNPLKYIDPSGHSWLSKNWNNAKSWSQDNWKTIATIAVVATVTIVAPYMFPALSSGLGGAVALGAIAGFTGGVVGTRLYGGSWSQALNNGIRGALIGGISGGVAYGVAGLTGSLFGLTSEAAHSASFFSGGNYMAATFKALAHVNIPIGGDSGDGGSPANNTKTGNVTGTLTFKHAVEDDQYYNTDHSIITPLTIDMNVYVTNIPISNNIDYRRNENTYNQWANRVDPPLQDMSALMFTPLAGSVIRSTGVAINAGNIYIIHNPDKFRMVYDFVDGYFKSGPNPSNREQVYGNLFKQLTN